MRDHISPRQFHASDGVEDWRVLGDGATAFFRTDSFAASARLVQAIAGIGGIEGHRPDVDIRSGGVTVRLVTVTPEYLGMTTGDVVLARRISAEARQLRASAEPSSVQSFLAIVGATRTAEVMPFWSAILG